MSEVTTTEVLARVNETLTILQGTEKSVVSALSTLADHNNDQTAHQGLIVETVTTTVGTKLPELVSAELKDTSSNLNTQIGSNVDDRIQAKINDKTLGVSNAVASVKELVSDAVDSNSSDTIASSKAVKATYDKASTAAETAESASSLASDAKTTANAAVPKTGSRGELAGSETAKALSGSQTITSDSPDCINLTTSGAVTLAFTAADATIRAVKAISLTASAATTLTISGAVWASKGSAPTWGNAGTILVLLAHFVGGRVVLSVADNTQ